MGNISSFLAKKLLDAVLTNTAYTPPTTVYLALFTTPIHFEDNIGTPTEVSGGSYGRQSVAFSASTNGLAASSGTVTFTTATGSWGTVVAVAICDASSSGNILFFDNICPQTVSSGQTAQFLAGAVKVGLGICC